MPVDVENAHTSLFKTYTLSCRVYGSTLKHFSRGSGISWCSHTLTRGHYRHYALRCTRGGAGGAAASHRRSSSTETAAIAVRSEAERGSEAALLLNALAVQHPRSSSSGTSTNS